uniref:BED-type domain-containing protein n=1 Tax=Oryza barthii TaxID=65489 RepID=A0A0D3HW32_9ORYZ
METGSSSSHNNFITLQQQQQLNIVVTPGGATAAAAPGFAGVVAGGGDEVTTLVQLLDLGPDFTVLPDSMRSMSHAIEDDEDDDVTSGGNNNPIYNEASVTAVRRPSRRWSAVWAHTEFVDPSENYVKCSYCAKILTANSKGGTSHVKCHSEKLTYVLVIPISCEGNARIFHSNNTSAPSSILAKIKKEGRIWVKAGAATLQEFGILGDIV